MTILDVAFMIGGMALVIVAGLMIEQLMYRFSNVLRRGLTGVVMILGPLITSAPELAIYLVSLFRGEVDVALGSVVAQPFMASTVIYPAIVVVSATAWLLGRRTHTIPHVERAVALPLILFTLPMVPLVYLRDLVSIAPQVFGALLLALYFIYARYVLRPAEKEEEERELWLRSAKIQLPASIALLYLGSEGLIKGIVSAATSLGMDEVGISILIIPLATVVPESVIGFIFIFRQRDTEGIAAVVGEKALYSTFYPGLALMMGLPLIYKPMAILALEIAIIVSILETVAIWFRRFGLTAPIGLFGYIYFIMVLSG